MSPVEFTATIWNTVNYLVFSPSREILVLMLEPKAVAPLRFDSFCSAAYIVMVGFAHIHIHKIIVVNP